MKKFILLLIVGLLFSSCGGNKNSYLKNPGFPQTYKDNFKTECVKNAKVNLSEYNARKYCDCALELIMQTYDTGHMADKEIGEMSSFELLDFVEPCQQ